MRTEQEIIKQINELHEVRKLFSKDNYKHELYSEETRLRFIEVKNYQIELLQWVLNGDNKNKIPLDLDKPWCVVEVIKTLIWATEYLLDEKNYDGHNHEELNMAVQKGKELINRLIEQQKYEIEKRN